MSNSIIPNTANNATLDDSSAYDSHLTDIERTPGAVAVMGSADVGLVDDTGPTTTPKPAFPATNSFPTIAEPYNPALRCGSMAVFSHCLNPDGKHWHGKVLLCGDDWCPTCGKYGSAAHRQRIAHKVSSSGPRSVNIRKLKSMGYLDIEFIDADRHNPRLMYSSNGILDTMDKVKDVLAGKRGKGNKRSGGYFSRGFNRLHHFGDRCLNAKYQGKKKTICKLTGKVCHSKAVRSCDNFENDGKLNQHFNLVVDGGYLSKQAIAGLKQDLCEALGVNKLIVHYEYTDKPGKMMHILKYVMRPTFLNRDWDRHYAMQLHGLNTAMYWGNWNTPEVWQLKTNDTGLSKIAALFDTKNGEHPHGTCTVADCGHAMAKWSRPIDKKIMDSWGAVEIPDTGIYRFELVEGKHYDFTPERILRLQKLESDGYFVNTSTGEVTPKHKKTIGGNYLSDAIAQHLIDEFEVEHARIAQASIETGLVGQDLLAYLRSLHINGDSGG